MTFGRHLLAAAVVAPLLVAGCSEDPKPKIAPPETSPAATSSAPSPEPKEAWERKTRAGAVAFVEHWIEVFNEAQATGDVAALQELSSPHCESCGNFVSLLEDIYGGGGSLESRGWRVMRTVMTPDLPPQRAIVALRIRQSPQIIRRSDGVEKFEGGVETYSAEMSWRGVGWQMDELVLLR